MSRVPPVSHLCNNCGFLKCCCRATAIIGLIKYKIEIAAGTVDVVEQKVGGDHLIIAVPLCKQLRKEFSREGIDNTAPEYIYIEGSFVREINPVKLISRFKGEASTRFEAHLDIKPAPRPVEEGAVICAKSTRNFSPLVCIDHGSDGRQIIITDRYDNVVTDFKILVEKFRGSPDLKINPISLFKLNPVGE